MLPSSKGEEYIDHVLCHVKQGDEYRLEAEVCFSFARRELVRLVNLRGKQWGGTMVREGFPSMQ